MPDWFDVNLGTIAAVIFLHQQEAERRRQEQLLLDRRRPWSTPDPTAPAHPVPSGATPGVRYAPIPRDDRESARHDGPAPLLPYRGPWTPAAGLAPAAGATSAPENVLYVGGSVEGVTTLGLELAEASGGTVRRVAADALATAWNAIPKAAKGIPGGQSLADGDVLLVTGLGHLSGQAASQLAALLGERQLRAAEGQGIADWGAIGCTVVARCDHGRVPSTMTAWRRIVIATEPEEPCPRCAPASRDGMTPTPSPSAVPAMDPAAAVAEIRAADVQGFRAIAARDVTALHGAAARIASAATASAAAAGDEASAVTGAARELLAFTARLTADDLGRDGLKIDRSWDLLVSRMQVPLERAKTRRP